MHRFGLIILLSILALVQVSCDGPHAPSVLVIAIDKLPFNLSLCSRELDDSERSGFQVLCDESISFTHATTTSTLSVPALASMLTGLNPSEHGVHHNGSPGLAANHATNAEVAAQKGWRTGFFSGGAPVWRRTGLHHGFENFDDQVAFTPTRLFRKFSDSADSFFQWLDGDVGESGFYAVFYVPDLALVDTITIAPTGENRGLDEESQLDELDGQLWKFIHRLKELHRWDDTTVIVTGLNGSETSPRPGEVEPMLLNSENTQVSLFVKPKIKPRDQALHWKIDRNVTLADVGQTLFALFDGHADSAATSVSLTSAFVKPSPDWEEERTLVVESGWALWHGWGPLRVGAFRDHDLLLNQTPPKMYNDLVDRLETTPQPLGEAEYQIISQWQNLGLSPWPGLDEIHQPLLQISLLDWVLPSHGTVLLQQLKAAASAKQNDGRAIQWAAQIAIEQKDWNTLAELAHRTKNATWLAVAEHNRGHHLPFHDACLDLLMSIHPGSQEIRSCTDDTFLALYSWLHTENDSEARESAHKKFQKIWEAQQMDLRILRTNAGLNLIWLPVSAEGNLPSPATMALALPELHKLNPL